MLDLKEIYERMGNTSDAEMSQVAYQILKEAMEAIERSWYDLDQRLAALENQAATRRSEGKE